MKARKPLRRYKPLRQGKPMKRSRMRRKPLRRVARGLGDPGYMEKVRKLPCCAPRSLAMAIAVVGYVDAMDHGGRIHAHHAGRRPGVGMKAPDSTCIALCERHHGDFHAGRGVFSRWTKEDKRKWQDAAIEDTQRLVQGQKAKEG